MRAAFLVSLFVMAGCDSCSSSREIPQESLLAPARGEFSQEEKDFFPIAIAVDSRIKVEETWFTKERNPWPAELKIPYQANALYSGKKLIISISETMVFEGDHLAFLILKTEKGLKAKASATHFTDVGPPFTFKATGIKSGIVKVNKAKFVSGEKLKGQFELEAEWSSPHSAHRNTFRGEFAVQIP